jgi:predicted regulator of Ras-like GTPase activity (Roadblock/LC7/MglB family)
MSNVDLTLHEEEHRGIVAVMDRLRTDANARIVFLLDRNGHPIAHSGELNDTDPAALASLAAGNVAATEGLAKLVGENSFTNLTHEGERDSLHLMAVGGRMILIVVYDERSSIGLVRLRVRKAAVDLGGILEKVQRKSLAAAPDGLSGVDFGDLSDTDLDALFSHN